MLPGQWQIIGTFVLPNLLLAVLLALPFIDRSPERSPRRRRFATAAGLLACSLLIGLTMRGVFSVPEVEAETTVDTLTMDPVARGQTLFQERKCIKCHTIAGEGGDKGPDLSRVGRRLRPDYIAPWIRNPRSFRPITEMPPFQGTEEELDGIVQYLLTLQ